MKPTHILATLLLAAAAAPSQARDLDLDIFTQPEANQKIQRQTESSKTITPLRNTPQKPKTTPTPKNEQNKTNLVSQSIGHLGLPNIRSKQDFISYFGECDDEGRSKKSSKESPDKEAYTCAARKTKKCATDINVGTCNLARFGFNDNNEVIWAYLALEGRNAITRGADAFQSAFGQQTPIPTQRNGLIIFSFSWNRSDMNIDMSNIISDPKNPTYGSSLIWIRPK